MKIHVAIVALRAMLVAALVLPPLLGGAEQALASTSIAQSSFCTTAGANGSAAAEGEGRVEPGAQDVAGERQLNVDIMIQPFILSSARPDNVTVSFRLCDTEDGSTISHVSYEITVSKTSDQGREVMRENFHSHAGPLVLQSYEQEEKNANATVEDAIRENFTNGWLADSNNEVRVKDLITSSGIYGIGVRILGAEDDGKLYPADGIPAFYYTAFVSESFPQQVQDLHNATETYNMTLLSFHDTPQNFTFNQDEGRIAWSIPFNWSRFMEVENKAGMGSVSQVIVFSDPVFDLSPASRDAFSLAVNGHPLDRESSIRAYDAGRSYTKSPTVVVTVAANDTAAIAEELALKGELPQTMDFVVSTQSIRIMPEFGPAAVLAAVAAMMAAAVLAARKNLAR